MFDKGANDESFWPSISDLMSGLMLVFLLISIAYMRNVEEEKRSIKKVAVAYQETQADLYQNLMSEFEKDLPKWKAEIDKKTLSVRFTEPDVLFKTGSFEVTPAFQAILRDFFPRYLSIIFSNKFKNSVSEIRIEGHTSSEWGNSGKTPRDTAYFLNMDLSQQRTQSVLKYCYSLIHNRTQRELMKKYVTANGLSSSHTILAASGKEDKRKSRRVEFRTKTNAEEKIVEIIQKIQK